MHEINNANYKKIAAKKLKIEEFSYRFPMLLPDRSKGVLMFGRQHCFIAVGGELR